MRILYAEDSQRLQRLVGMLLRSRGHEIETVENGQALLDRLGHSGFDVVITNNIMPVMTGMQALAFMRASIRHATLPVIIVSGDDMTQKAAEYNAVFIQKGTDNFREVLLAELAKISGATR